MDNYSFTEKNYRDILIETNKNYKFVNYTDDLSEKNIVLWRHDVDFTPHRALILANIEKELGTRSTFFIQITSNFYNIFENEIKDIFSEIINLGHSIGLHFDPSFYDINGSDAFVNWLEYEKTILEKMFDMKICVFSFHNPTTDILKFDDFRYANMINTYSKEIKNDFKYCSDSNGYWRFDKLDEIVKENFDKLHILTHPVWWQKEFMTPRDKVQRCIDLRAKKQASFYDNLLEINGRVNVK